jgi:hypothetical protein
MSKPEESSYQPANQNQKDNTMANKFDDPGMTAAAVAEVAVETAKAARKNIHISDGFFVSCVLMT